MRERVTYETGGYRLIAERGFHPAGGSETGVNVWWEDERGKILNHRPLFIPDTTVTTALRLIEIAAGLTGPNGERGTQE